MRPLSPVVQSQAVEEHDTWQHSFSDIDDKPALQYVVSCAIRLFKLFFSRKFRSVTVNELHLCIAEAKSSL